MTAVLRGLSSVCPILEASDGSGQIPPAIFNELGNWCECIALILPRTGDTDSEIRRDGVAALQQILSRCVWTRDCMFSFYKTLQTPSKTLILLLILICVSETTLFVKKVC